jgi:hypothetical protein
MVERRSHVTDCPDQQRSGMQWFLDAAFPNGETVTIRAFTGESEASECPVGFRYLKSIRDNRSDLSAQTPILSPSNLNALASGLATVAAALSERTKQIWSHVNGRGLGVSTHLAVLERSVALGYGPASLASRSLTRLNEKWKNATSTPWFALLCAGVSFAALLVFTGAIAGVALTKQPVRMDMVPEARIEASAQREQFQPKPTARSYDNDPIATLIELTSHREGISAGPASLCTGPNEVEGTSTRMESAAAAVHLGLPRTLLDARSFATVPLSDRSTNGHFD